jgi:ABC-type uncharacterized transport system involved in gliding motility auxiliary subunit
MDDGGSPVNLQKTFTFIGLVLLLTGLVVTGLFGHFTTVSTILCILGLIAGSFLFIPRVTGNRWLYLNMALYSLFFCASLLVFYFILLRHPASYDATKGKLFSLSPISKNFVSRLQVPIHAVGFYGNKAERTETALMFGQYARFSPQFTYDIVNPFTDVETAHRFGVSVVPGDIYLERLTTDTKRVQRTVKVAKPAEEEITNGIVQLLRGGDVTLYFLTGHGEPELEENKIAKAMGTSQQEPDFTWLKAQLERSYIKVVPLPLAQRRKVPADASAVVIAAPRLDISSNERDALAAYLDNGGRAIFMLNPDMPQVGGKVQTQLSNVSDLLEKYGIQIPSDIVVMPMQPAQSGGDMYTVTATAKKHPVTQLQGNNTITFEQARPVNASKVLQGSQKINATVNVKDLAPQSLGIAATRHLPGKPDEQATRMVVVGNGNFVTTRYVDQNGWLLFLNAVNWLTNSADLIAIPTMQIENTPVVITEAQSRFLFIILVIAIPTLIGLGGLGYAITRRGHLNPR